MEGVLRVCGRVGQGTAGGRGQGAREEGASVSILHRLLPCLAQCADGFFQCLTTRVMGGNGPSRPGGNLGFGV